MFLAFGYQPGFGPLAVAYAAANIASAIPLTPGAVAYLRLRLKPGENNSSERAGSTP